MDASLSSSPPLVDRLATTTADADREVKDNARVAYQVAASLMTYEGNLIWARFGAMLVAHSVILVVIGTASDSLRSTSMALALPAVGLSLCVVWALMMRRGFDYYRYWILSMRELEELYLNPPAVTISRGGLFAAGEQVKLVIDGMPRTHRLSGLGRGLSISMSCYVVVAVFAVLYLLYLIFPNR